jgi:hypothetical protein
MNQDFRVALFEDCQELMCQGLKDLRFEVSRFQGFEVSAFQEIKFLT